MGPGRLRFKLPAIVILLTLAAMGSVLLTRGARGPSERQATRGETTGGAERDDLRTTLAASTGSCGVFRWSVKTGTDPDAGKIGRAHV